MSTALRFVVVLALFAAGFSSAWYVQGQRAEARVQALMSAQAQRDKANAKDAQRKLSTALKAADASTAIALSRERAAYSTAEELRHALAAATSRTRQCLSPDAVRVLNDPDPRGTGTQLSETSVGPSQSPPPAAANSSGSAGASEQAVADWITEARRMYEICRSRVDAVRTWADTTK